MGVAIYEQETTINIMRDSDVARVFTSDSTMMTRLDKLVEREDCPEWKLVEEHYSQGGELVGKTYETNKRLVSFRSNIITRELSEEQRKELSERFRDAQEKKKLEQEQESGEV